MNQPIKSFSFKSGLRTELEIIPISYLFSEHRESIALPHRAEFYHVFWFTKGNPVFTVDFIPIALKPDSLLFVRKNRVQFFDQSGYYEGWILLFTDTFFNRTPLDRQFLTSTILFHDLLSIPTLDMSLTETDLTLLLTQIQRELSQPEAPFQADILHNFLHNLLLYSDRERRRQDFQPYIHS